MGHHITPDSERGVEYGDIPVLSGVLIGGAAGQSGQESNSGGVIWSQCFEGRQTEERGGVDDQGSITVQKAWWRE